MDDVKNIIMAPGCNRNRGYAEFFVRKLEGIEDTGEYKIIKDYGEGFGKTKPSPNNVLCLVPHGNRQVSVMKDRFKYLDTICDDVWSVMGSPLQRFLIFDRSGYSGGRRTKVTSDKVVRNKLTERIFNLMGPEESPEYTYEFLKTQYIQKNESKYIQPKKANFDYGKPFILVLGQKSGDSVIEFTNFPVPKNLILGSKTVVSNGGEKVVIDDRPDNNASYLNTYLTALPILDTFGIPIIYKPHILESQDHNGALNNFIINNLKNTSILTDKVSIHELFPKCQAVVTINSGAGFEALLHLKPVVTLGRVDYSPATFNCSTIQDIKDCKSFIEAPDISPDEIKRFLHAYISNTFPDFCEPTYLRLVEYLLAKEYSEME